MSMLEKPTGIDWTEWDLELYDKRLDLNSIGAEGAEIAVRQIVADFNVEKWAGVMAPVHKKSTHRGKVIISIPLVEDEDGAWVHLNVDKLDVDRDTYSELDRIIAAFERLIARCKKNRLTAIDDL